MAKYVRQPPADLDVVVFVAGGEVDEYHISLGYYGDSVFNSMGDIAACVVGFVLASRLPTRVTLLMVLVMELALTLTIRDSLLLNVVMLIYPIEAVKTWQLGGATLH